MATIAESFSDRHGSAKLPISAHPAFPAIVALWFAALIGLGSLVLPVALLERLVTMTGIASLVSSAAPPLGFTARAAIALSGSIAGALLGLVLARKIAQSQSPEPKPRFVGDAGRLCRPISAHEELGDDSLEGADGSRPVVQKRRTLAMSEGETRSTYLEPAPLPGHSQFFPAEAAEEDDGFLRADETSGAILSQPLELGEFPGFSEEADARRADDDSAIEALRSRVHASEDSQEHAMSEQPNFDQPNGDDELYAFDPDESFDSGEYSETGGEPLPFAAPSLRRDQPAELDSAEADEDEYLAMAEDVNPQLSVVPHADEVLDDGFAVADRPLEDLGLVQLAARLGASLRKRKARQTAPAQTDFSPAPMALATTEEFDAVGAEDAARAIADFFAPAGALEPEAQPVVAPVEAPVVPTALHSSPLQSDDEDDEALSASFRLPLGETSSGESVASEQAEDEFDEQDEEAEYSSLLAMKNPFARPQEFVRVEEPEPESDAIEPAVTFPTTAASPQRPFDPPRNAANPHVPAAAPRDPGDAEQSLRDALATLQRMSGAA